MERFNRAVRPVLWKLLTDKNARESNYTGQRVE